MRKLVLLLAALSFTIAGTALAFHDAGVAHCDGCHTMHNSQDGALVDPDSPNGNQYLLVDATASDVCLGCHADHLGSVFGDDPLNPPDLIAAGNFCYLTEDNLNDGHGGASNPIPGDAAGHNIVAPGFGVAADATLSSSPGGAYPSSILSCTACHDPHGNDDFRMLNGVGAVQDGMFTFSNAAPEALGRSIFGGAPGSHTAYQSGMSEWCGNCHGDFHNSGDLIHPSGSTLGGVHNIYNLYNGTADITGGDQATAYLEEVPFEDMNNTSLTSTEGPTGSSKVMCLTCHRAHASSAPDAGRWDFSVTLLDEDGDESGSYPLPDPYADDDQRSLCNKCHAKDVDDHIATP